MLDFVPFSFVTTASNICDVMLNTIESFEIKANVQVIVSDGGANILAALTELRRSVDLPHIVATRMS